jgi:hypothetical protein
MTLKNIILFALYTLGLIFIFWGFIQIVTYFSVPIHGWFTFLAVITPNIIALITLGYGSIRTYLKIKARRTPNTSNTQLNDAMTPSVAPSKSESKEDAHL